MAKKKERNVEVRSTLKALKVGELAFFPMEKEGTVRQTASLLGLQGMYFRCSIDRIAGKITARRVRKSL